MPTCKKSTNLVRARSRTAPEQACTQRHPPLLPTGAQLPLPLQPLQPTALTPVDQRGPAGRPPHKVVHERVLEVAVPHARPAVNRRSSSSGAGGGWVAAPAGGWQAPLGACRAVPPLDHSHVQAKSCPSPSGHAQLAELGIVVGVSDACVAGSQPVAP